MDSEESKRTCHGDNMTEVWVDLCDEEGNHGEYYQISSLGRVRSLDRMVATKGGRKAHRKGKVLSQCIHKGGYAVVGLAINGRNKQRLVNRLVAFSFRGQPPEAGMEAAHGDGVRTNNREDNIRWATKLENAADKRLHGTDNRGSTNPRAKLTEEDIAIILDMSKRGFDQNQIAAKVGSNSVSVNHVLTGRTWASVTGIQHVRRHAEITAAIIRRMRMLKRLGMTLQDIGDTLGISKAAVFRNTGPAL